MGTLDAIACLAHGSSNRWLLHLLRALQARIATASAPRAVAALAQTSHYYNASASSSGGAGGHYNPYSSYYGTRHRQRATRAGGSTGAAAALVTRSLLGCVASCAGMPEISLCFWSQAMLTHCCCGSQTLLASSAHLRASAERVLRSPPR